MKNSIKNKHEKSDNPTVKSCEIVNDITDEKIKNYIPPALGPDNNVWHTGKSNPLGSKGN
ncbi:hypothetical protein [Anaeromicropila herbilytica]|uniref:Uncharacterized protein n=1 Tax=Anaeromicropila herbilytica TaxID=2785025 RepID=A0A7R7EN05_9FIRM|nr:hypothetical protein [Anaeromicropila herbilytica]BCN31768.1 hypothetical protein bsdtb5_30630 [Anaeromicropila herbilytica]